MTGAMLYLAWLSAGTPIPMNVCDALAGCMDYWREHQLPNPGRFALSDDNAPIVLDSGKYVILDGGAPQPLTGRHIAQLKAYLRKNLSDPDGQIAPVAKLLRDPEAIAWAREKRHG